MNTRISPLHLALLFATVVVFAWSGWHPYDRLTWWLEVAPGILGAALLILTYSRFRFTTLVYTTIALHIMLLCVGGHYTYARVPLFAWIEPYFGWHRNHFDRLGHFAQGFVPALIARELFVRLRVVSSGGWRIAIIILICMGISALYELLEWVTALISGSAATAFLGTQGDVWDTQEDMFMAGIGASVALLLLSRVHDVALLRLPSPMYGAEERVAHEGN
jgi:putative membrane protein